MAAYFFHLNLLYYQLFGLGFSLNAWWGGRCDWLGYGWLVQWLILATFVLAWATDKIYRRANARIDALTAINRAAVSQVPAPSGRGTG